MALTLDGTTPMPYLGSTGGGTGLAAGAGAIGGLILGSLINNNGNGGLFGGNNNNGALATAATTDVVMNPAFQSLQQQITNMSSQLANGDLQDAIARNSLQLANFQTASTNDNFTTLTSINGLGRDVQTQVNATNVNMLQNFNQLGIQTLSQFNNLQNQVQNTTNQIISQGTAAAAANAANFCQLEREMATCCCDIKGAIAADGNATRALINDLNVQSLRDQLAAANNQVSNNAQNQYLLSTILHHITPTAGVAIV